MPQVYGKSMEQHVLFFLNMLILSVRGMAMIGSQITVLGMESRVGDGLLQFRNDAGHEKRQLKEHTTQVSHVLL